MKTLKQRREEERKAAEASGDTRAWNSLFMRPDTVCFLKRNKLQTVGLSASGVAIEILNDACQYLSFFSRLNK